MATDVRYEPPSEADWTRLVNKPQINTSMQRIAGQGMGFAISISPFDTGVYAGSFDVQSSTSSMTFRGKTRQAVDLVNTADHALLVELKHRVLARTAGFIGGLP